MAFIHIRETKTPTGQPPCISEKAVEKDKKTRKTYHSYKLAEFVRTEKGPRQRVLPNLGADFDLEEGKWKELCRLIDEKLRGNAQATLFETDMELSRLAERIV